MKYPAHILIFDSGLGGTTILAELKKRLPACRYSYAMDNAAFPYGEKSDSYLLKRFYPLFCAIIDYTQPDLVVVACNTASTLFLDQLRSHFPDLPFVGVVPAIKPAAQLSQSGVIALLATPATIHRQYIDALKQAHAANCQLVRLCHQDLAILAERKMRGEGIEQSLFDAIVAEFKRCPQAEQIDTIVLGCTHYPAIQPELAQAWQQPITWVDSGAAIAKRCEKLLEEQKAALLIKPATLLLTSKNHQDALMRSFMPLSIEHCHIIEMADVCA